MPMDALFDAQRRAFAVERSPTLAVRLDRLARLQQMLDAEGDALLAAIDLDFSGRSPTESQIIELFPSLEGIRYARRHLARWMKPERRHVSFWFAPARAEVRYQPKGVVGIVVPWNYPLFLAIGPLTAALAAGNRAMLKLSEYCPRFSAAFAAAVSRHFSPEEVAVVEGSAKVAQHFVALPFDHLLFTGSTAVGRHVMTAAAKSLTPVTLELGGKSPVILGEDFPIASAAQRIVFAKLTNGGQTCVAPDYVLLPQARRDEFIAAARAAASQLYGSGTSDYASIVSDRHHTRLKSLMEEARANGAHVELLLEKDALPGRKMAPAILTNVTRDMGVMREEIFGPLLPVLTYSQLDEALAFINAGDRPLALYVFDNDPARIDRILASTHSGGVAINDGLLQVAQDDLPFGGIGASGMGAYHGPEGFKTFSHARGIFRQSSINSMPLLYPPYGKRTAWILRLMLRRWRKSC
ncbi:MAG TPA: coniferyl aldehyde dehydrogenase [Rhodocyclaceae bacterium]|nr:coniferyl aldehyde dehydrogenase [Rhodocyclaceae bacterium]